MRGSFRSRLSWRARFALADVLPKSRVPSSMRRVDAERAPAKLPSLMPYRALQLAREPQWRAFTRARFTLKCPFHSVSHPHAGRNAVACFSVDSFANVMEPMLPLHVVDPSGSAFQGGLG